MAAASGPIPDQSAICIGEFAADDHHQVDEVPQTREDDAEQGDAEQKHEYPGPDFPHIEPMEAKQSTEE